MFELTSRGVESATASLTLEMLCLLVIDKNLEVVEVALAVVAPRTREDFVEVGVVALLLRHLADTKAHASSRSESDVALRKGENSDDQKVWRPCQ
jgi:hypothetical protein